jgi:hypothetical protein
VRGLTGSHVDGGAGAARKRATTVLLVDVLCFWCAQGQGQRGKHGLQGGSGRERMRAGARGGERKRGQGWARRNQGGRRTRWRRSAGRCDAAGGRPGRRRLCNRDAGARAQRQRDVTGAEDFISRGEAIGEAQAEKMRPRVRLRENLQGMQEPT